MEPLNNEDKELIRELSEHPGFKSYLKLLELCTALAEKEVIQMTIDSIEAEKRLVVKKARAEGARGLGNRLQIEVDKIRLKRKV